MKKYLLFLLVFAQAQVGFTQIIVPLIVNNNGSQGAVNNIRFEFSLGESFTATIANGSIISQGLLQPLSDQQAVILPIIGLEFGAKRINANQVQLTWKTIREVNNLGFYIERRRENENSFTGVDFRPSADVDGNAYLPLQYQYVDANNFAGGTYYRLKQVDIDSNFSYSTIRFVNGQGSKHIAMKAWPVPSNGVVNILAEGIENDQLLVFDNSGRLVKQVLLFAHSAVQLTGLLPGNYVIMLASHKEINQKIIIQ